MEITASATTATSTTLTFTTVPGDTLAIDVRYGWRPDFMWCLAPVIRHAGTGPLALSGLNQAAIYYFQARPISTTGQEGAWTDVIGVATPVLALRDTSPANIMIEPALIIPPAPVLTWAADDEEAGHPVRTLGRDDPNSTWWSQRVGLVFGLEARIAPAPIDSIAVLATNASETSTITIKAGADAANVQGGAPTFVHVSRPFRASAGLPGRKSYHSYVRLPAPQSYPYWRIEIGGPVPGDMFVATYVVFGLAHSTRNFASDSKAETLVDLGAIERDRSGNPSRIDGHRSRSVEFEIVNMPEAQYETAFEQLRWLIGSTTPALVIPNSRPGAFLHDRILYGTMKPGRASNTYSPRYSQQFSVESLI